MKIEDLLKKKITLPVKGLVFDIVVGDFEAALITAALKLHGGNITATAKFLRLKYSTMTMKMSKAGIKPERKYFAR